MRVLLDTDTCIGCLRGQSKPLDHLEAEGSDGVAVSAITVMELRLGAHLSGSPTREFKAVEAFLAPIRILPFDSEEASAAANLLQSCRKKGLHPGPFDLLIGATAKAHGLIVATGNAKHFAMMSGLKLENWLR